MDTNLKFSVGDLVKVTHTTNIPGYLQVPGTYVGTTVFEIVMTFPNAEPYYLVCSSKHNYWVRSDQLELCWPT